jgi:hypothetical protein
MPNVVRIRRHSTRARRTSLCALCALCALGAACGHSRGDVGRPEATLSASADAQAAFRALRAAWFSGSANERRELDPELRAFLARFPKDESSDMVAVLIAFDCVSRGALSEARALIAGVREDVGTVNDFAQVADGAILLREGNPGGAWDVLEPLAGKIIDADERLVFGELRLRAAAAAQRYARALQAAEELLAEAPVETQSALQETVRELFRSAPKADLVLGLSNYDHAEPDEDAISKAREWLRKMLREELVSIAVRDKDALLARRLLDSAPAALRASESGSALVGIAGGGRSVPLILGRSIGVALSLGDADERRRSASLVAGLARGLGLPDAAEEPGAVHLISHDDGGSSAGTADALRELAAEGAAILVAGVDAESAQVAARFADENQIAVMVVQVPGAESRPLPHAFWLGESSRAEQAAIDGELRHRDLERTAGVGAAGVACDAPLLSAGSPRFPIEQWRRDRVTALIMLGSAACASDVARELRAASFSPLLALGLDASEFVYESDAPEARFAVGAGRFPSAKRADPATNPALPPVDWYEALGHDAALLAKGALEGFPDGRVDDGRVVRELHARAEQALGTAQATLWTSDSRGFSNAHVLSRALTIVSPNSPPPKNP